MAGAHKPFSVRVNEQAGTIESIEAKVDLALEMLFAVTEALNESEEIVIDSNDIESWKQRCRARQARKRQRR